MDKHIFLIGMMGCGKSTIGRRLSALAGHGKNGEVKAHE